MIEFSVFRLLKFLPVLIPLVSKAVKSPRGQKVVADVKRQIAARRRGGTSGRTR